MNSSDVALVTGGNKGIGLEIVRGLAIRGLTVWLGARDPERGRAAADRLTSEAGGLAIRHVQLDVTDDASVAAAISTVEDVTGRLDVLVNNAGVMGVDRFQETFEVNVFGVVRVTSACLPLLRRSPNPRIVNVSSGLGSLTLLSAPDSPLPAGGFPAYSSSKAALNALTVVYANLLRADGIKVNATSPGLVPTDQNATVPFPRGDRTTADGAAVPILLATLPPDGPTGVFRGPNSLDEVIPW